MSTARKPGLFRRLSIGAALLGVAAAPVALAVPASAATTLQGCTVNPLTPVFAGWTAGVKQVRYNVAIACTPDRTVQVEQVVIEDDTAPDVDDPIVVRSNSIPSGANGLFDTRGIKEALPDTEGGPEEMYHNVRFRVTPTATGVPGPWTAFERSGTLTIAN